MSLKFSIIYLISSLFLIVNNLFASHVTVVDGDTIKLGDIKIRFSGIDAPEMKQLCQRTFLSIFIFSFNSLIFASSAAGILK